MLVLFVAFKITSRCFLKYEYDEESKTYVMIRKGKFYWIYSQLVKIFVMLYGFFSFDYWFATILDLSNLTRCFTHHNSNEHDLHGEEEHNIEYQAKTLISSFSALALLSGWVYVMIYLKFHYSEQYVSTNKIKFRERKVILKKETLDEYKFNIKKNLNMNFKFTRKKYKTKSEFDKFVESLKHGGLKKSIHYKNHDIPAFCANFNFYFLAVFKFIIIIMVTFSSSGLAQLGISMILLIGFYLAMTFYQVRYGFMESKLEFMFRLF